MLNEIDEDGAIMLTIAILRQAKRDYAKAYKAMMKNPNDMSKKRECDKIAKFLKSNPYEILSTLDGEAILEDVRKDIETNGRVKGNHKML